MTVGMAELAPVIAATWPPEQVHAHDPFLIFQAHGGGSRVRAARLADTRGEGAGVSRNQVATAMRAMTDLGQDPLFMVLNTQGALDVTLDGMDLTIKDPTQALTMPTAELAAAPPPVTCFEAWPPLAVQEEIWRLDDIGPDRLAIMARAEGPKISLFGRAGDKPAGTAFVACHGDIAMLHALVVAPAARRQGLAGHMMRAAGDWAQRIGATTFCVLVTQQNIAARGLYTSLGFQPVGHYHYRKQPA